MADDRQAILERALGGDTGARGELLEQFRPYVRRLVQMTRHGLPPARVGDSDLIQDALLAANQSFGSFRGSEVAQFAAWLRGLTLRVVGHASRHHRGTDKRDANREVVLEDGHALAHEGSSPEARAAAHEQHARVAAALEQLPEEMQRLLLGRIFEGLSFRELAGLTGRREGALRVQYVRALRKLRDLLS